MTLATSPPGVAAIGTPVTGAPSVPLGTPSPSAFSTLSNPNAPATWQSNMNYKLILYNHGESNVDDRMVISYIPENFHLNIQNTWEPFMNMGDSNTITGANKLLSMANFSINLKFLSALVWKRTEPLQFSFTFQFDARDKPAYDDVTLPVMRMIKMASPSRDSVLGEALLHTPGPTFANINNRISLRVGRFFYLDSVVVNSLAITWYTAADSNGDFIAADVEAALEAWYTPDSTDIMAYFGIVDPNIADNSINQQTNFFLKNSSFNYEQNQDPTVYTPRPTQAGQAIINGINSTASFLGIPNPLITPIAPPSS
jgi:hypothetical protein